MHLTASEYATFTQTHVPEDFESCLSYAQQLLDAHTLYAYVGTDESILPAVIRTAYKQALALQTQAISQQGGVTGLANGPIVSATLGKFSYTTGTGGAVQDAVSPGVRALLPMLVGYARGLMA